MFVIDGMAFAAVPFHTGFVKRVPQACGQSEHDFPVMAHSHQIICFRLSDRTAKNGCSTHCFQRSETSPIRQSGANLFKNYLVWMKHYSTPSPPGTSFTKRWFLKTYLRSYLLLLMGFKHVVRTRQRPISCTVNLWAPAERLTLCIGSTAWNKSQAMRMTTFFQVTN